MRRCARRCGAKADLAGCVANTPHVDLSVSAFKALFALDIGLVDGVEARVIDDPNSSYDKRTVRRTL